MATIRVVWSQELPYSFGALLMGEVARRDRVSLVVGDEFGKVHIFRIDEDRLDEETTLDTKGGCIQCLTHHDLTRFGTADLVVGDSDGVVAVLSGGLLLCRVAGSFPITSLVVDVDPHNNFVVVSGDSGGTLAAFLPYAPQWKTRVSDLLSDDGSAGGSVRCLLPATLPDPQGRQVHHLIVGVGGRHLLFLHDGSLAFRLEVPCVINHLCLGLFDPSRPGPQVLAAGEDGVLYLLNVDSVVAYASLGYTVTRILPIRLPGESEDSVVCTGHFCGIKIIRRRKLWADVVTEDWVHCMGIGKIGTEGGVRVVAGFDHTLCLYEVKGSL